MHDSAPFSRHLSLTTLQLFVAVCETGSIGQAAEREFIAASAVSKRLSDLETDVGVPLLERHSRGVKPTAAGENLLQHARGILFDVQRLQTDLLEYAEGVRGHVRIFANLSAIVQFLPEDLGSFASAQPGIKIDLQERMSSETLAAIQEGAVELGICYTPGATPTMLQAKPYHQDRLVLVMPHEHALARQAHPEGIHFAQALDCDFVGLHSASSIGLLMRQAAAAAGRSLRQRIQVTGLDTMCRMIDNGLGIGIMPDRAFALMHPLGRLQALPLADAWAWRQSWIVARDFDALPGSARLLVEHLEARARAQAVQTRLQALAASPAAPPPAPWPA
ncbi:LysR family transcriptional regulator [Corticibacter populi]|uniref:LysR family transcriptional regulator n=1 Tax=Corticibacter populi TaxID=1550736 RepID=A0A3M6R0F6_9BURK|nr:LysR family transcriptional regulator [Corticibacter populi]RMX08728.1 LysR family transcriptional regulator [Corticibacter populi]RZS36078.1 DNA-binding transcriptional LysR family regulator [Corticibacter populi]